MNGVVNQLKLVEKETLFPDCLPTITPTSYLLFFVKLFMVFLVEFILCIGSVFYHPPEWCYDIFKPCFLESVVRFEFILILNRLLSTPQNKKTIITFLYILKIAGNPAIVNMGISVFGKNPTGERLERIKHSPNYTNGQFQNLSPTPAFAENVNMGGIIYEKIFKKFPKLKPDHPLPSVKTDLHHLDPSKNELIWFGHSSYYLQTDGLRFLIDPVFSENAAPLFHTLMAFPGSNIYTVSDLPEIDYLLITHDHYDHLDRQTIRALKGKVKRVICGLGVGSHLEYWGYAPEKIIEKDWYEDIKINEHFTIFVEPARHFSGRGFVRNKTLWVSYVLQTPSLNIYLGGDSGYDFHYAEIGRKYGPFDLAVLENGQYNKSWPYIHETPDEVLKAAADLHALRILPVHSSKFALANHPWYEPLARLTELNAHAKLNLITPKIGEVVDLDNREQKFERWWEGDEG